MVLWSPNLCDFNVSVSMAWTLYWFLKLWRPNLNVGGIKRIECKRKHFILRFNGYTLVRITRGYDIVHITFPFDILICKKIIFNAMKTDKKHTLTTGKKYFSGRFKACSKGKQALFEKKCWRLPITSKPRKVCTPEVRYSLFITWCL